MKSSESRVCIDCGTDLPENGSASSCARCLLKACFEEESVYGAPEAVGVIPANLAAPGEIFGDYELLEEIARGGMGMVFKARQRSLDRVVALKMMLPGWLNNRETVRRFRLEAEAASRLMHPGIVSIHDVGECEGQHFYSMNYIDGLDLGRYLEKGPIAPELAARWTRSIAEAIHHAHQHGILHRDLKPGNVLIDGHAQPHVTDFGLAKLLDDARELTASGRLLGTPSFMPPEQADPNRGGVTVASDVYGLGAIFYFLLTGQAPFEGSTIERTITLLLTEDPLPPSRRRPGIPRDLETICLKCLSKEPHRRYASAADLAEDLAAWSRHEPIQARAVQPWERLWFWARRNPWLAGVSVGLVMTAALGAVMQQRALRETRRAQEATQRALNESRQAWAAAEGLIQYMNEDLTEQLRPLGRLQLLDKVNRTVQQYYQGLPMKDNPADPVAGKVQFFQNNAAVLRELGRLNEAGESAKSAIALLQPLTQREPRNAQWMAILGDTHAELRNIFAASDPTAALQNAQEAVRYCGRAYELGATNEQAVAKLANAHLELASVFQQQDKPADADQQVHKAIELLASRPLTGTNSRNTRAQLALSSYYQGLIHFDQGRKEQARQQFAQYLERIQQLAAEVNDPTDARALQSQVIAHGHLGRALLAMKEPGDALEHFRESHRLAQNLQQTDPGNVNYQLEFGFSLDWLAEALAQNGEPAEDITELLSQARAVFQKLANTFPQGDVWQDHAARTLTRLADWYGRTKHPSESRQLLAEELAHRWDLLLQFSDHRPHHRRFIEALDISEDSDGPPGASPTNGVQRLQGWLAKASAESGKPNGSPAWNWTLSALHNRIAAGFAVQNEFDSARRELELALPLWKRLAHEHPKDIPAAVGVAQTYCALSISNLRGRAFGPSIKAVQSLLDWLREKRCPPAAEPQIAEVAVGLQEELAKSKSKSSPSPGERAVLQEFDRRMAEFKSPRPH